MRTPNYIKLADCSRIILSWLCIFGTIGAYLHFAGYSQVEIVSVFSVYMIICIIYLLLSEKKSQKPRMSYLMHPMFLSGIVLGLFITIVEDEGRNIVPMSFYIVFIAAGYMVNYYLSSYVISLTETTTSGAGIILKNSKKQHKLFFIWLICFIIVALAVVFVPSGNLWRYIAAWIRSLFGNNNTSQNKENIPQSVLDEEPVNSYVQDTSCSGSLLHVIVALLLINLVLILLILIRKILKKDFFEVQEEENRADDVIEEISEIKYPHKSGKKDDLTTGNAGVKVRRFFSKTVKKYHNNNIDSSKTPTQLLGCEKAEEKELRDIYHKARYSCGEVTADDVGRAKELSGSLIKERDKTKKSNF